MMEEYFVQLLNVKENLFHWASHLKGVLKFYFVMQWHALIAN